MTRYEKGNRNPKDARIKETEYTIRDKFRDKSLLIVDDNIINNKVLMAMLKIFGIVPDSAESGQIAIKMVANKKYDLIFMDCPPVEMLADASIIAKYADKTLFVVRAGLLEREMLPIIDKYYDEQKLPNMAVLLNGTEKFNGHYGYHYGYYHHYGNYYNDDKTTD